MDEKEEADAQAAFMIEFGCCSSALTGWGIIASPRTHLLSSVILAFNRHMTHRRGRWCCHRHLCCHHRYYPIHCSPLDPPHFLDQKM